MLRIIKFSHTSIFMGDSGSAAPVITKWRDALNGVIK